MQINGRKQIFCIASQHIQLISMSGCNSFIFLLSIFVFFEKSDIAHGRMAMHSTRWRARVSNKKPFAIANIAPVCNFREAASEQKHKPLY